MKKFLKTLKIIQKNWKKQRVRRVVYCTVLGIICLLGTMIFCGNKIITNINETKAKELAAKEKAAKEQAAKEKEEARQRQIDHVLEVDKYGEELAFLYDEYPQLETLLLNRDVYPDWLIEYFIDHTEAINWVIDYPKYMQKTEEEIDKTALAEINLDNYEKQNGVPLFFQWDHTWGYASYGSGTIAVNGCGPTCLSMVAVALTGDTTITPKTVADYSVQAGYCTEDNETAWGLLGTGASHFGLKSRQLTNWTPHALLENLKNDNLIICTVQPGDFTKTGHYIVLVGVTDDDKIIVNDPNSSQNSHKSWDAQTLLDQTKSAWIYEKNH